MADDSQIVRANNNLKLSYGWPSKRKTLGINKRIKALRQGRIWIWGLTHRRAIKEETINHDFLQPGMQTWRRCKVNNHDTFAYVICVPLNVFEKEIPRLVRMSCASAILRSLPTSGRFFFQKNEFFSFFDIL